MLFSKKEIFKMQRPLFSNDPDAKTLIYNEDRSVLQYLDMDDDLLQSLFGDEMKVYAMCKVNKRRKKIELEYVLDEEDWPEW